MCSKKFSTGSKHYRTILQWIEAGAPDDPKDLPTPVSLEIEPKQMELDAAGGKQQVKATAKYSDGSSRDVTSLALFQTSNDNSATIDKSDGRSGPKPVWWHEPAPEPPCRSSPRYATVSTS